MFDYFYGDEPKQFAFYAIPQLLFTDEKFKGLSCDAKVLYGLLLDKAGLSVKNGWTDNDGKVFVYYKREEVCSMLGCKKDKAIKILAELDDEKGIGLIKRVPQGQGKPTKIYVRHFLRIINSENAGNPASLLCDDNTEKFEPTNSDVGSDNKTDVKGSEKPTSRGRKNRRQEVGKTDCLPISHTKRTILSESTYPINQDQDVQNPTSEKTEQSTNDRIDKMDYLNKLEEIRDRVNADYILSLTNPTTELPCYSPSEIDELVELIAWSELTAQPSLKINGEYVDIELVRIRFSKLDEEHIMYVIDCLKENTVKISQRRNYLLTCLYNAPSSISGYYANLVNHDLYGDG